MMAEQPSPELRASRRDLENAFAGMLSSAYVVLRRAGLSPEMTRGELVDQLNSRLDKLNHGVPPAWEREVDDG